MANGRKTGGRVAGTPNKFNADLRAIILGALSDVGGQDYLAARAVDQPVAFLGLIGRVLPLQMTGQNGTGPMILQIVTGVPMPEPGEEPCIHDGG